MHPYWKYIRAHGIYLKDKIGTRDWALKRDAAITALEVLKNISVEMLGGDVLFEKDNKFYYIFQNQVIGNWSCTRLDDEPFEQYLERSLFESREYIEKFPEDDAGKYYYVLVPGNGSMEMQKKEFQELSDVLKKWKYFVTDHNDGYAWLVEPILSSLHHGLDDFSELKEFIEEQIKRHFHIPIIYNMDIESSVKEIVEWYKGGIH